MSACISVSTSSTHLELPGRAELVQVIFRNLGHFQQPRLPFVINDGTALDVGLGLVCDFHDIFGLRIHHRLEDVEIDHSAEVVYVRDEDIFLAGGEELLQKTRVAAHKPRVKFSVRLCSLQGVKDVSVSGRVPVRLVTGRAVRAWQEALLVDSGVSGLVEREDLDVVVLVFLDDAGGVLIGVERVHEDEGDIAVVRRVQVLLLSAVPIP